jgi:hypothetical protein
MIATATGVVLIAFALLVAFYANEPFNIASLFGIVGAALIAWVWRRQTAKE